MSAISVNRHEWPGNRIQAVKQPSPFTAIKKMRFGKKLHSDEKSIRKEKDTVKEENRAEGKGKGGPFLCLSDTGIEDILKVKKMDPGHC